MSRVCTIRGHTFPSLPFPSNVQRWGSFEVATTEWPSRVGCAGWRLLFRSKMGRQCLILFFREPVADVIEVGRVRTG